MEISENKIRAIVEKVVSQISSDSTSQRSSSINPIQKTPYTSINTNTDIGTFDDLEQAIKAAENSYHEYQNFSLEKRKKIIDEIRRTCISEVNNLSKMAVEETGMGRFEDKIQKNILAIENTPGVEDLLTFARSGDHGLTIWERAPYGVVASITPCTNPSETIICNGIGFIAAGNSAVFCPHPLAKKTSVYTINILNQAIIKAGGPPNLLNTLRNPSIALAQSLMTHPKVELLVVTGGPEVVRKAMTCGKKVIGAGPGNPPVVVDETADIEKAAINIVKGASMDNNIICIDEKEVFVVSTIAEKLKKFMLDNGAYEVKGWHLKQLEKLVLEENKGPRKHAVINKKWVGKDAHVILDEIGISVGKDIRLIIVLTEEDHPFVWTELLMPILPIVKVSDVDYGIAIAKEAEHGFRHTACMHSHDLSKLSKMARVMNTSIFVKNGPAYAGLGLGGEGHASFTIASPTGEGVTSAKNFTKERRCVVVDHFRII